METDRVKGTLFALAACLIWGLIFVIPQWMEGFSPFEIVFGRYFFYGMLSFSLFLYGFFRKNFQELFPFFPKALRLSFASTFGYYICAVLSMRFCSPAVCALVLGIAPITIAFYANMKQKEVNFTTLLAPSVFVILGLVLINIPHLSLTDHPGNYLLGLLLALGALIGWTWYVIVNAHFLKTRQDISPGDWSTLLGVATFVWWILFGVVGYFFFGDTLDARKYFNLRASGIQFWLGTAFLGLVCSWLGAFLWNRASVYLPVTLAGQIMIFETIFGVSFLYLLKRTLPDPLEGLGIAVLLFGVLYGIRKFTEKRSIAS